jgi:hypothetical protein
MKIVAFEAGDTEIEETRGEDCEVEPELFAMSLATPASSLPLLLSFVRGWGSSLPCLGWGAFGILALPQFGFVDLSLLPSSFSSLSMRSCVTTATILSSLDFALDIPPLLGPPLSLTRPCRALRRAPSIACHFHISQHSLIFKSLSSISSISSRS